MIGHFSARHLVWAAIFTSVGTLSALAQDQEDPQLARLFAQRGWFDWAQEMCDRVEKSSRVSAEEKASGSFVKAEMNSLMAEREIDVEKAKEYIDVAVKLLKDFIAKNAAHPLVMDARTNIGWLQGRKAKFFKDAMETEADPVRQADLKKGAISIYREAEQFYRSLIDELKKAKTTDAISDAIMDNRLALPRTMFDRAKLEEEKDRKTLLTEAITLLVDFEFDYGDRPIAFEAMLEEGLCLLELGDFKQAEAKLRGTQALKDRLREAKIRPNDYHNKIIYGAYVALAQMLTRAGKAGDARAMIDQFFKENKGAEKEWVGLALKIEKADALFSLKDIGGANTLVNEVIKADPNGRFGAMARKKVRDWSTAPGGAALRLPPDHWVTVADSYMEKEDYRNAVVSLRKAIEGCMGDAEKTKFQPSAYFKMALCFQELKRNYEAAFAFETVYRLFPKSEWAAKGCYETLRCYIAEFAISGDKRDGDLEEKYLACLMRDYPNDPVSRNLPYIQAQKLEAARKFKDAAALYLQVVESAEAYESALVRAGYCYHVDGSEKWGKGSKDTAIQAEVKAEMRLAKEALLKFMARMDNPALAPKDPDLLKIRQGLGFIANQRLALIYTHDAVGESGEALKFLKKCAEGIPPGDERLSKIWQLMIQAHLARKEVDQAVKILDLMFTEFPNGAAIAQACKSVAIHLDDQTAEMIRNKADVKAINANLMRVSKYYAKWLDEGPARGLHITMTDVRSVAEALYMIAKRINGLDEQTISFLDLRGREIAERHYFVDAATVHAMLLGGKVGALSDKDRILLMTRLARCYSFIARDVGEWGNAKDAYETIVKHYKMVDAQSGALVVAVLQKHRELLGVYLEFSSSLYEIGRKGPEQKFQLDNASTAFNNLVAVAAGNSEPWWLAKYMVIATLFERGDPKDITVAEISLKMIEANYPNFDEGKFGLKDLFLELKRKIKQVTGGK